MEEPEETYEQSKVRCPYCLELLSDSWELGDGGEGCGEIECGHCEREFVWSRSFTVIYKGIPISSAEVRDRHPEGGNENHENRAGGGSLD
jgi:hypothetical protein